MKTKDGKEIEVTAEGSLGLLALGYRGLIAWRQKRVEEIKKTENQEQPQTSNPEPETKS